MKTCKVCGCRVSKKSKKGYCNKCRPRSGVNNPFYGKTHTKETIQLIKEKTREASKNLWKNPEYREKVITNTTGKTRSDKFKNKQSINALKQFRNWNQKNIRSEKMKETWKLCKIQPHINPSINRSKIEQEFYDELSKRILNVTRKTVRLFGKWVVPDVIINNNHIYEFYGDYWHGNPKKYAATDIVHHGLTAQQIWDSDKTRVKMLEAKGYFVTIIWESVYKKDKNKVIDEIDTYMNWDCLS